MSLKEALLGRIVACCAHIGVQHATTEELHATSNATAAQPKLQIALELVDIHTTTDATGVQLPSCIGSKKEPKQVALNLPAIRPLRETLNPSLAPDPLQLACTWLLRIGTQELQVVAVPAMRRAEIMADYPAAKSAEVAQGCKSCRHAIRPGQALYCGSDERSDLESVYSINHPAKRLPSDHGAACEAFGGQG